MQEQNIFSYENMMLNGVIDAHGYRATMSDGFITLKSIEIVQMGDKLDTRGWKFHISIDDTDEENLIRAWNILAEVFVKYNINFTKFQFLNNVRDIDGSEYDVGRQGTIYASLNKNISDEVWMEMFNEITDLFVQNNIKPGYTNPASKLLNGSSYIARRNDLPKDISVDVREYLSCREVCRDFRDFNAERRYNPHDHKGNFDSLYIDNLKQLGPKIFPVEAAPRKCCRCVIC